MKTAPRAFSIAIAFALLGTMACGGGGSSSGPPSGGGGGGQSQSITITTHSQLPGALQGHAYTTTLAATGGQGALHWSIAPIGSTQFVTGLAIDANTGVLSGTPTFAETGTFAATVTDSGTTVQTQAAVFNIFATATLTFASTNNLFPLQYIAGGGYNLAINGGLPPFTVSFNASCLPPGMKPNAANSFTNNFPNIIVGTPLAVGTYTCNITVQDSYSPPQSGSQVLSILVIPPNLQIASALPSKLLLNRPVSARILGLGGRPPYTLSLDSGVQLPPGLSFDASTAQISGTPTSLGQYSIGIRAFDSNSPAMFTANYFSVTVVPAVGRNDSPVTATPIGNGTINATISPYVDPANGTPTAGDQDYYVVSSLGSAVVHMETNLNGPVDTVLEIVDGNGHQLSTCRQLGDTSTNFNSACLNDDIGSGILRSALEVQVPGASNASTNLYIHVLDWRGDARPDMRYSLSVLGVATPLQITSATSLFAIVGNGYNRPLSASGGTGRYGWSVASGTLPPGMTLANTGFFELAGTLAAAGTYTFDVRVDDTGPPAQSATVTITLNVVSQLQITTKTLPQGKVGTAYSATINITGGVSPYSFTVFPVLLPPGLAIDPATGAISGTPTASGTYTGQVQVTDSSGQTNSQFETIVVNP